MFTNVLSKADTHLNKYGCVQRSMKGRNMLNQKPVIGISAVLYDESRDYRITRSYAEAVTESGALPLMIPSCMPQEDVEALLPELDGLFIPGGADVDPLLYGEEPRQALGLTKNANDRFEIHLLKVARRAHKPILCVCRGEQILNVAFGGTLYQDLPSQYPNALRHQQTPVGRNDPTHSIEITRPSLLFEIFGTERTVVNSFHHQAVKDLAHGFTVSARAKDGVIEAIEIPEEHILGVQWHPEAMYLVHSEHQALFRWLAEAAR